jgi:hypothetical protein
MSKKSKKNRKKIKVKFPPSVSIPVEAAKVIQTSWSDLPALPDVFADGWKFTDDDITPELGRVAARYLADVNVAGLADTSEFIESLSYQAEAFTVAQVRGILNILGARIKGQRKRWHRTLAKHADSTLPRCFVCARELTAPKSEDREIGPVCYVRVMGDWTK